MLSCNGNNKLKKRMFFFNLIDDFMFKNNIISIRFDYYNDQARVFETWNETVLSLRLKYDGYFLMKTSPTMK